MSATTSSPLDALDHFYSPPRPPLSKVHYGGAILKLWSVVRYRAADVWLYRAAV